LQCVEHPNDVQTFEIIENLQIFRAIIVEQ